MTRTLWVLVAIAVFGAAACSIEVSSADFRATAGQETTVPVPNETPSNAEAPQVTATPTPAAPPITAEPEPSSEPNAEPEPESESESESTEPDNTPVVIDGGDWVTTEQDVAEMMDFIERTHQLEFRADVGVIVSNDIGAEFARGFEPFDRDAWSLLRGLGLADSPRDRDVANQVRLDRIRGLCCTFDDGTKVVVEIGPTKLATDLIVVHELTHALHTQHRELFSASFGDSIETPQPAAAASEGVPQFITFEYMKLAPEEEQAQIRDELPIIRPDMVPLIGSGPSQHLNFAYAAGPALVDAVVADRGLEGLGQLIGAPPTTTEQVVFPQKYLDGETAVEVVPPRLPADAVSPRSPGTIGAAMLMFTLVDLVGEQDARSLVEGWAGDSYVVFNQEVDACLVATIEMDAADQADDLASALAEALQVSFPATEAEVADNTVSLATCGLA